MWREGWREGGKKERGEGEGEGESEKEGLRYKIQSTNQILPRRHNTKSRKWLLFPTPLSHFLSTLSFFLLSSLSSAMFSV
jgi:hypothetical protein